MHNTQTTTLSMSDEGESGASNDFFHKWPPLFGKKPATNTADPAIAANAVVEK